MGSLPVFVLGLCVGLSAATDRDDASTPLLGLHWMAPVLSSGGYSSEALAFLKGLLAAKPPFAVSAQQHGDSIDHSFFEGLPRQDQEVLQTALYRGPGNDGKPFVTVCHSEPGAWHMPHLGLRQRYPTSHCPHPSSAFRVGRTMFETDRVPTGWPERLNAMDEVWVPTAFTAKIFEEAGVKKEKLVIVPEAVDTEFFSPKITSANAAGVPSSKDKAALIGKKLPPLVNEDLRKRVGCAQGRKGTGTDCPYRFLAVGKWERRKNFEALVLAFLREFHLLPLSSSSSSSTDPPVNTELIIVTSQYHSDKNIKEELQSLIRDRLRCKTSSEEDDLCVPAGAADALSRDTPIKLLHGVPQLLLPRLYASVDAFVLPSRGEGWGRPHVEAMAMSLPVVATNWSGPTEFLSEANGYPVPFTNLAPIPDGAFAGHLQAEVDVRALERTMRDIVENQQEAKEKGKKARADMVTRFSLQALAEVLQGHVERISRKLQRAKEEGEVEGMKDEL